MATQNPCYYLVVTSNISDVMSGIISYILNTHVLNFSFISMGGIMTSRKDSAGLSKQNRCLRLSCRESFRSGIVLLNTQCPPRSF